MATRKTLSRRNLNIVMILVGVFSGMVGLTFASVPLYRIFCAKTGFDGTPVRADGETVSITPIDRSVTVSFTSDVDGTLPWAFYPKQNKIQARVGETYLAFFEAENLTDQPITGRATFNVSPEPWGPYFVKIQCFCFNQQTLQPHEKVEMPVTFYLDPGLAKDHLLDRMSDVTLSYTFFRSAEPEQSETKIGAAVPDAAKTVN
ncbi:MAG TPA: cytochrome c oxidase assembly protein [Dongiaceae bacterium]|nr:cytochrome c oxidase assembly protein [Dongiaceae bacterium]